ncbi:MAG: hypothetical protein ABJN26_22675 [Stappiaceae bacterium]|uniref:hypothetical protein n=1 Tax=Roseibium sp. TaxID=1936156 RepID=UPI003296A40D
MHLFILHLDDQPEFVSWIPGMLYRHLKRRFGRDCQHNEVERNADKTRADYIIPQGAQHHQAEVTYELLYKKDSFRDRFKELNGDDVAVAVFDLHIGDDTQAGIDLVEELFGSDSKQADSQWIVLTAFAAEGEEELEDLGLKDAGNVIAKPPNTTDFVKKLGDAIASKIEKADAA